MGRLVRDELRKPSVIPCTDQIQVVHRDDRDTAAAVGPAGGVLEEARVQARSGDRDRSSPPSGVPDRARRVDHGVGRRRDPRVTAANRERRIEVGGHGGAEVIDEVLHVRGQGDEQRRTLRPDLPLVFHRGRAGGG